MKRSTKFFSVISLLVLSVLVFVPTAQAFDGRRGDRIVIGADEVINDDLYLGATEIIIDGTVNGDVMAVGKTVILNGNITGDFWAAGRAISINGEVGDDVFTAGQVVTLDSEARVIDDVFSAGASVETRSDSQIGGTLLIGASQGMVAGAVAEDLLVGSERLRLDGPVGRNARLWVGTPESSYTPGPVYMFGADSPAMPSVPAGLTFGSEASILGTLEYTSQREFSIPAGIASKVTFSLPPADQQVRIELAQQDGADSKVFNAIRRMIALLVVGLLLALLFPALILNPATKLHNRPLPSLGLGLVGLAVFPVLVLVALGVVVMLAILFGALTLGQLLAAVLAIGLPTVMLAGVTFAVMLAYVPQAVVAYLGGRWVLERVRPDWAENRYGALFTGLLILGLLLAIPVAGGVLNFLVVLFGLGALVLMLLERRSDPPALVEVAPAS